MRFLIKKEELERLIDGAPYLAPYREKAKDVLGYYVMEETDYYPHTIGDTIYYIHRYLTKLFDKTLTNPGMHDIIAKRKFILDDEGTAWVVIEYVVGNRRENLVILNEYEDLMPEELEARIEAALKYIETLIETYAKSFDRIINKSIAVLNEALDKAGIERKSKQSADFEVGYKKINKPTHGILRAVGTLKEIADVVKRHEDDKDSN